VPLDQQLVWIMTLRDGKLARLDAYPSVSAALEAAVRVR
jgi:ketosteroid isomerase-like protein